MENLFSFITHAKGYKEDGKCKLKGIASTNATDRYGDIIVSDAWKSGCENYKKNPIILFNHNHNTPIGKATSINPVESGLEIEAEIYDPNTASMIEAGVLKALSVGFIPKDMEYDRNTGGFIIKEVDLIEISVVSVPANQEAIFDVIKSLSGKSLKSVYDSASLPAPVSEEGNRPLIGKTMNPEDIVNAIRESGVLGDIEAKAKAAAKIALAEETAALKAKEKAAKDEAARAEKLREASVKSSTEAVEKILESAMKTFEASQEQSKQEMAELKAALQERADEVKALRDSKRVFAGDHKEVTAALKEEITDAYILGVATRKGMDTKYGKEVLERASNADSGLAVPDSSQNPFENEASTTIERDIQHKLILAPLFRTIQMNSKTMSLPILPDAGYAEFARRSAKGDPHGNLAQRGDTVGSPYGGVDLAEKVLTVSTLVSQSFLGDETEEDSILPILPLIRESIIRSHARSIEHGILMGGHADALNPNGFDGLVEMAKDATSNTQSTTAFAGYKLTAADLMTARRKLGKYGIRPNEVIYIVNEKGYYDLIDDVEFQDNNLVGTLATKVTGSVGQIYGSPVLVCDEFAAPAISKHHAVALWPGNYVVTRLRGVRLEEDREVRNQQRVIVASQRLGFEDIIANAKSVHTLQYAGS